MLSYDELTPVEQALWDAFPEGRWVDLRTGVPEDDDPARGGQWGPERTVRAAVVTALLLGANAAQPGAVASLRLAGARITGQLDLAEAEIAYTLWLRACRLEERAVFYAASTRTVRIRDSRIPGISATLARIDGHLDLKRSTVDGGRVSLANARVAGELLLNGAKLLPADEWALFAGGLVMEGGVFCHQGFIARGGLRLQGAQLPGGLFLRGARVENPGGTALATDNVTATVLDFSEGFSATGTVQLRGARVADLLTFEGASFGDGTALVCARMQAEDFDFRPAAPPSGTVDLRGALVTSLHDHERSWPDEVLLEGFGYGSLRSEDTPRRDDVALRLSWLRRTPGYAPQPYEQLAGWYRKMGHDDDARRVLLAKQRHRRRSLHPAGRAWGHLLDITVGYGYRPWLAGLWLTALALLGALTFGAHTPTETKRGEGPPFNPLVYTLDLLIPIGGLGQRGAWHWTDDVPQGLSYALIAIGWMLTTAVVAGVTRALSKN